MKLIIKSRIAERIKADLARISIQMEKDHYGHSWKDVTVDMSALTRAEQEDLQKLLESCGIHGTKVLAADVKKFLKVSEEGIETMQARTVRQAAWMLEHYFARLPHHIIFSRDRYEGGSHTGYYVADVKYHPEVDRSSHSNYQPEHVTVTLAHIENDERRVSGWDLYAEDCVLMQPVEILAEAGYVPESPQLIKRLKEETERYYRVREMVGKRFQAKGIGVADLDNAMKAGHYVGITRNSSRLRLDNMGVLSNVVVDILKETNSEDRTYRNTGHVDVYRWHDWNMRYHTPSEDDLVRHLEADDTTVEKPVLQLPVHPLVPCFDLSKHVRLRVHVNNLTEYGYDRNVANNLVLSDRDWRMVQLLIDQSRNTFQDIVAGKGQSMNILSEGPPGTGKTVTTEVLAEFKERALYTVQCSQLGLEPDEVERNLSVVMQRANRWDAILLLDEADVYIRKRGEDILQNAIVGAFLRVLEYAACILVMTTNLPDDVDDAIASRCIVRLRYEVPDTGMQSRIWRNLAKLNGIALADKDIEAFANKHTLTGRDVKNLLKLASFVADSDGKPVTVETLEFVLQFKPTATK